MINWSELTRKIEKIVLVVRWMIFNPVHRIYPEMAYSPWREIGFHACFVSLFRRPARRVLLSHDVAVETDRGDCCPAPRTDNTLRTMSDNCPSDPVRPSALPCQSEVKFYVKQATSRSLCMPSDENDRPACKGLGLKYISYTLSILWEKIKSCIEHDFWRGKIGNSLRKIRPKETLDCPKNINVRRFADVSPWKNRKSLKNHTVSSGLNAQYPTRNAPPVWPRSYKYCTRLEDNLRHLGWALQQKSFAYSITLSFWPTLTL
jgi:hypothetical protein